MKKWIISNPKNPPPMYKLVASYTRPVGAICEAPEHYTDEMEPYFVISKVPGPGGHTIFNVGLSPRFGELKESEKIKTQQESFESAQNVASVIKKNEDNEWHNSLNPAQRFFSSLLGDLVDAAGPAVFTFLLKLIFGSKLG